MSNKQQTEPTIKLTPQQEVAQRKLAKLLDRLKKKEMRLFEKAAKPQLRLWREDEEAN